MIKGKPKRRLYKRAHNSRPIIGASNRANIDDLSEEQKRYALAYQEHSKQMLAKIGHVFLGPKASLVQAAKQMDDLVKDIENYIMVKTKRSLNLQEFVMIFGSLAGIQAGMSAAFGFKSLENKDYHDAGQLFEAAMRAVSKSVETQARAAKVAPPAVPQRKH